MATTVPAMTSVNPLVTVVIPSYNHERFVAQCIESVLRQTYQRIELIVIDDGSPDRSQEVIQSLADQHGFVFVRQMNAGLTAVLNRGIDMARGKYFVSLGSDDLMLPDRVEKQVDLLEHRPDVAICAGNCRVIDASGREEPRQHYFEARELTFEDLFAHTKPGIKAPTAMIRKSILVEVGGYDPEIKLEDIYMWLKITSAGHKAYALGDVIGYHRKHGSNQSGDVSFMADHIEAIYREYQAHPLHDAVIHKRLANLFNKAVKRRLPGAWNVLRRIPPRHYDAKLLVNVLVRLIRPPTKPRAG
jgi:alpha-1,3-rhamnosyltransferase